MIGLTIRAKDVAEHSPEVFILSEAVHHLSQATGAITEINGQTINQSRVDQELSNRRGDKLQHHHQPRAIITFLKYEDTIKHI